MAWESISGYLGKFFAITPPKKFYQGEVIKALNEILNINLSEKDIEYRFGIIYIKKNNPTIRSEIFLNKEKILRILSQKIKNSQVKDISFSN